MKPIIPGDTFRVRTTHHGDVNVIVELVAEPKPGQPRREVVVKATNWHAATRHFRLFEESLRACIVQEAT